MQVKRVLMVAFHFPPATGSSGIQRTLRFVQHLPQLGWEPVVLTVMPMAHERTSADLLQDVPAGVTVIRCFAVDAARHLSIAGRYPRFLARPDRWQTWYLSGTIAGLSVIRRMRCDALWSTYPIATAHRIGASLHQRTGVPWIADFRDPMAQDGYPADLQTRRMFEAIEERAIQGAARCVFTTPGAARLYCERYSPVSTERIAVIENGYDEESFAEAERGDGSEADNDLHRRLTVLHSGIVYPSERDPTHLMEALALLKGRGVLSPNNFRLRFRGSGHDALIERLSHCAGVRDLIELAPATQYRSALKEMLHADALIVMQASNCNAQIPAKLYEYLRARRPIIALADPAGDTADALRRAGIVTMAPLDSAPAIADLLRRFIEQPSMRSQLEPAKDAVQRASRSSRSAQLAGLLDGLVTHRGASGRGSVCCTSD